MKRQPRQSGFRAQTRIKRTGTFYAYVRGLRELSDGTGGGSHSKTISWEDAKTCGHRDDLARGRREGFYRSKHVSDGSPAGSKMRPAWRRAGFSLTEMLVVVSIMVILMGIAIPTAIEIQKSFESSDGVIHVIEAALGTARAMALRDSTYVGIRFQEDRQGNPYMVLIRYKADNAGVADEFIAVPNRKPIRLPGNTMLIDTMKRTNTTDAHDPTDEPIVKTLPNGSVNLNLSDESINTEPEMRDVTTFVVLFDRQGRLISRNVHVRNSDGYDETNDTSLDKVFNTQANVESDYALLYQDDYPAMGLGEEPSRNTFYLVSRNEFAKVNRLDRYEDYLRYQTPLYVNTYSGEIINK